MSKTKWLDNKTVIITGASSGIGKTLAYKLITKHNCHVIGVGRSEQKMLDFISELKDKSGNFEYELFDVGLEDNWVKFAKSLQDRKIDILINNAGILPSFAKFEKQLDDENLCKNIRSVMDINFMSVVYSCAYILPIIEKSDNPALINVSSSAGLCALPGISIYSASKGAVKNFTESVMFEKNYYVGLICPGFTKTNIFRNQKHTTDSKLINLISTDVDKMVNKIYRGILKKKKRIVCGLDARFMDFIYRTFRTSGIGLCTKILKSAKIELFEDVFD